MIPRPIRMVLCSLPFRLVSVFEDGRLPRFRAKLDGSHCAPQDPAKTGGTYSKCHRHGYTLGFSDRRNVCALP